MTRKLVVEALGTFFLVLTIGLTVLEGGAGAIAPLASGSVLMVMVYAGGHISGAHYNPAVSLAVWLRGKATTRELAGYSAVQVAGGLAGAAVARMLRETAVAPADGPAVGALLLAELLFTFALAYVVLNVATARGTQGNSYFGLAIGFTLMVAAFAVGPISGAAVNPAVTFGALALGLLDAGDLWAYLVAQLGGGALAALVFNAFRLADDKPTTATPAAQAGLRQAGETGGRR